MERTATRTLATLTLLATALGAARAAVPRGWTILEMGGAASYEVNRDTTVVHSGQASVSMKRIGGEGRYGCLFQQIKADHYRGKRIRLTGFVKTAGAGREGRASASLLLRVNGLDRPLFQDDMSEDRPIRGTTDWKQYALVLNVPKEARTVWIEIALVGGGQMWVDDLKIEVVSNAVPTTNNLRVVGIGSQGSPDKLNALLSEFVNLDFDQ